MKYKEFQSFEKLIEKAELTAMATEEAQVRGRINAYQTRSAEPELDQLEALERLNAKIDGNTFQKDLEKRLEKMQNQLTAQKSVSFAEKIPQIYTPRERSENLVFCEFHNTWGYHKTNNCYSKLHQIDSICRRCNEKGHLSNFCPQTKNSKPLPPAGFDSNGIKQTVRTNKEN